MRKKSKLLYGVGVNDADYDISKHLKIDGKNRQIWTCPFYRAWSGILSRCYCKSYRLKYLSYSDCSVIPEWHYFMTFRAWMEKQDWEGKQLDKDILYPGNKLYSPDTCVFVDQNVNKFLIESDKARGEWPIGVSFHKASGKFIAQCQDPDIGIQRHLGLFNDPESAHQAWLTFKLNKAKLLADQQSDSRVAKALIERYENYGR